MTFFYGLFLLNRERVNIKNASNYAKIEDFDKNLFLYIGENSSVYRTIYSCIERFFR